VNITNRPTPETDEDEARCATFKPETRALVMRNRARRLERQRDAAVEALERIAKWDGEHPDEAGEWMCDEARATLAAIKGAK